jgi:hypothetical protein
MFMTLFFLLLAVFSPIALAILIWFFVSYIRFLINEKRIEKLERFESERRSKEEKE